MNLAVVGSRSFNDYARMCAVLARVRTPITCIVSGGAVGADKLAERWANEHGIATLIFLPDYNAHGQRAPLIRNRLIMQSCDNCLAFWDGISTGTPQAIRQAGELGKPVHIVHYRA